MTFNGKKIDLPKVVIIKLNREPLLFHLMLKQGIAWFTLATETQETMQILNKCRYTSNILFSDGLHPTTQVQHFAHLF